jgi:nitric oxide reductase subunit B
MVDTSADATRLSPWWRHSANLVMIAGFSVLSSVTVLTYTNAPPIPEQVTDVTGSVLFTGADIQMGQDVFLKDRRRAAGSPLLLHGSRHHAQNSVEKLRAQTTLHFVYG